MQTKYLLVLWPESQEFIGRPDCYFCQCNDEALDQAIFVPEEIFYETFNITATSEYIENNLYDNENVIYQSVSKLLMDTSEENPLECEIVIETPEDCGLSSLLLPRVNKIWQDPEEGWIRLQYEGSDDITEFEYLDIEEKLQILKGLEYENSNTRTSN
jgi:hypothetical protein